MGFVVDADEDAREIQDGGDDGGFYHLGIGEAGAVRHQEGGGPHDGGHELAAGGGGGFHRAGKFRAIAQLFHGGDGKGAGTNGIGHGGTGDRALQGGCDNRHLGGAADALAGQGVGQIDKQLAHAGFLQEGAEEDKQENIGGGYP